jgi:prophage regulatory protein
MTTPRILIRLPLVLTRTGLSRSLIYQLIARGEFPRPVRVGARLSTWIADEVDEWVAGRIAASRGGASRAA